MTGAVHGGALWQPNIRASTDYDSIVAADVNYAWYPPAPRVLEAIAQWAPRANHSPDTSGLALREAIARHFSISLGAIRLGAGSSDLLHHIISSRVSAGDRSDDARSDLRGVRARSGVPRRDHDHAADFFDQHDGAVQSEQSDR